MRKDFNYLTTSRSCNAILLQGYNLQLVLHWMASGLVWAFGFFIAKEWNGGDW